MPTARLELAAVSSVTHGALDFEELERLGLKPDEVVDFSVNSNPFGPPPGIWPALNRVAIDRYPDREALALRRSIADWMQIDMAQILAANGTAELIWLVALAYVQPGDSVLVIGPTFGEYARASQMMGARVEYWTARPETGFAFDVAEIGRKLERRSFRLVFVCTPNNPTGQSLPHAALVNWGQACPQTLFVIDEAYLAFAAETQSAAQLEVANLLILRSMTKDYALAGLRLGYAVGSVAAIDALRKVRPAWSVNALAQAAGVAALQDKTFLPASMEKLGRAKRFLIEGLTGLGYQPVVSHVHYFLLLVENGADFRRALLPSGFLVRDCASFGLPAYARLAPRLPDENARLLEVLRGLKR